MKTILVTLEYPPFKGGVANYYENVVKYWPEKERIEVVNNNDKKLVDDKFLFFKWRIAFSTLRKKIKKNDHVLIGNLLPLGTVAFLLSFFIDFKYSVFIHGTDLSYAKKKARKRILAKIILDRAESIICNSSFTAKFVEDFLNYKIKHLVIPTGAKRSGGIPRVIFPKKIKIVHPGVSDHEADISHAKLEVKNKYNLENKKVLFSIGRLIKRKGVDSVIKLMPEILSQDKNVVYVIGGIGQDEKYLKNLAKDNKNIIFLGRLKEIEKWAWLSSCDVFVQVARSEAGNFDGFGIVYLEANLAGKPVIAGNSGGVCDAVKDGVNGLMVDPENLEEIKKVVLKLLKNKELSRKLGKDGQIRAKEEFSCKKQVEKIYSLIK